MSFRTYKKLTYAEEREIIELQGKISGKKLAREKGISTDRVYRLWKERQEFPSLEDGKFKEVKNYCNGMCSSCCKKEKVRKWRLLNALEKIEIIDQKGKKSYKKLAEEWQISPIRVYKIWNEPKEELIAEAEKLVEDENIEKYLKDLMNDLDLEDQSNKETSNKETSKDDTNKET